MWLNNLFYEFKHACLLLFCHFGTEPVEALVQTIACGSTAGLNVPRAALESMKSQFVGNFGCSLCLWKILLVSKDKQNGILEFILRKHFGQFLSRVLETRFVVRV